MRVRQVFLSIVIVGSLSTVQLAQKKARPTQGEKQGSSVPEILAGLDKDALARARVGVKSKGSPWGEVSPNMDTLGEVTPGTTMIFAQGFKLEKVDACTITLRNEDTRTIAPSNLVAAFEDHFALEVYLPLESLSDSKGKAPYRHTKNLDKAKLLGTWRTEFTYQGIFTKTPISIAYFAPGTRETPGPRLFKTVTFTFDDKEMADRFNSALRQAIRLCKQR